MITKRTFASMQGIFRGLSRWVTAHRWIDEPRSTGGAEERPAQASMNAGIRDGSRTDRQTLEAVCGHELSPGEHDQRRAVIALSDQRIILCGLVETPARWGQVSRVFAKCSKMMVPCGFGEQQAATRVGGPPEPGRRRREIPLRPIEKARDIEAIVIMNMRVHE